MTELTQAGDQRHAPSVKVDFFYGMISMGTSTLWVVLSGWLLYFYLPPEGEGSALVPAALYGIVMFGLRVVNAAITPSIGYFSDRTRSRWGRRLPFMFFSALPMLVFFVFLWSPPVQGNSIWNLVYLVIMMAGYDICFVLNQVPYMALLPEIALTDHHRIRVSAWASGFMVIGMVMGAAVGPLVANMSYTTMALIYAGVLLPFFYLPFLVLRERHDPKRQPAERLDFRQNIATMMQNRAFLVMTATGACYWGITMLVQSVIPYIVTEVCLLSEADTLFFYVPALLASMLCYPLITSLSKRWGKWVVFAGSMLASAIILPGLFLIGDWWPISLRAQGIIWIALQAAAFSGVMVLPRAFGAEIVDYDEELTGQRREGIYYATWGMLDQVINGVGAALVPLLLLLGRSQHDPNGPLGVRLVGVVGGVLLFVGFLIFLRYPLRKRSTAQEAVP